MSCTIGKLTNQNQNKILIVRLTLFFFNFKMKLINLVTLFTLSRICPVLSNSIHLPLMLHSSTALWIPIFHTKVTTLADAIFSFLFFYVLCLKNIMAASRNFSKVTYLIKKEFEYINITKKKNSKYIKFYNFLILTKWKNKLKKNWQEKVKTKNTIWE